MSPKAEVEVTFLVLSESSTATLMNFVSLNNIVLFFFVAADQTNVLVTQRNSKLRQIVTNLDKVVITIDGPCQVVWW